MTQNWPIDHFDSIAERIVVCAQAVRDAVGAKASEQDYENALERTLRENHLQFARQYPFGVPFAGPADRGFYADFVVEGWILLELKVVPALAAEHADQALNYLRESGCRLCLLINFGRQTVEVQRLVPPPDGQILW